MNGIAVSVIVPCRNEAGRIRGCLDSILRQDFSAGEWEIIVVDGMSTDGTDRIVREYAGRRGSRVRLVLNPRQVTPCALNAGIREARGEVIIRMDAHAYYERDYIRLCLEHMETSAADNVGSRMVTVPSGKGLIARGIAQVISSPFGVGNSYFRVGTAASRWVDTVFGGCYRKEAFSRVGFFNEDLHRGQDMEFNLRLKAAGLRTLLVPQIRSYYYAKGSWPEFVRHNFVNGVWAVLPFKYSKVVPVSLRSLVPLFFVAGVAALLAVGLTLLPAAMIWLTLLLAFYALAALAVSSVIAVKEKEAGYLWVLPWLFFSLHFSYGIGSLAGAIKLPLMKGKNNA